MVSVLALTNMYPPHHLGGYELSCRDVMARLAARGHAVTVLTTDMRRPGVADPPGERATGVRRDLTMYWDDHDLVSPPVWRRVAIERANQRALRDAIDAARPDVVSVWNMGAMSFGLLTTIAARRVPVVLAVCDDWLRYGPNLDAWSRLFTGRRRLGVVAATVLRAPPGPPDPTVGDVAACFVSRDVRARAEVALGHPIGRAAVVYSGIDRVDFPLAAPDARPWRGRLLFVGRLDERKGLETVLAALAHMGGTSLDIVGPGPADYRARLEQRVAQLGLGDRVRFDEVPRSQLAEQYRAADAFVFPSEWDEPFGLVPVEAMACGTPVIASGTGGSAEFLVDGANCLIAAPGQAVAWAAAINRLAGNAELRSRLVRGGLATADELDVERLADVFEAWHAAAADRFANGTPPHRPPLTASLAAVPDG
ncbi:MAG: glycosyltransferase [Acidimicrobiales bacterium]|jgi:glycogen(starch) synthase|nr:glycosyltransferase [Acidimicrobiales bacterium]